jgi:hypothetical protein
MSTTVQPEAKATSLMPQIGASPTADASALNLWAGQQWRRAQEVPVATILDDLLPTLGGD